MDAVANATWDEARYDSTYTIGLDLGQSQDFTAIVVLERFVQPLREVDPATGNQRSVVRYEIRHLGRPPLGTPYPAIVTHVTSLVHSLIQWKKLRDQEGNKIVKIVAPSLVVDKTGVGAPVVDLLKAAKLNPIPVVIHGGDAVSHDHPDWRVPKRDIIASLQVALQNKQLLIAKNLPLTPTLVSELKNFRVKINIATAHDSYEAWREGQHDDLLLAAALAFWWAEGRHAPKGGNTKVYGY